MYVTESNKCEKNIKTVSGDDYYVQLTEEGVSESKGKEIRKESEFDVQMSQKSSISQSDNISMIVDTSDVITCKDDNVTLGY